MLIKMQAHVHIIYNTKLQNEQKISYFNIFFLN